MGFAGALCVVAIVIVGHRSMILSVVPPFSWAIAPDIGPLIMALVVPLMLSILIVRLAEKRKRVFVSILMMVMVGVYSVLPVVAPMAARGNLLAGKTKVDSHGICLQTHGYTCGPAAAVTCLGVLGIHGDEGLIAVGARSAPAVGTDPILLKQAVRKLYGSQGACCDYRITFDLDRVHVPFIATMWIPRLGGHYVAVLEVAKGFVVVGDPLSGRDKWDRQEFLHDWTGGVHEIRRVQ